LNEKSLLDKIGKGKELRSDRGPRLYTLCVDKSIGIFLQVIEIKETSNRVYEGERKKGIYWLSLSSDDVKE